MKTRQLSPKTLYLVLAVSLTLTVTAQNPIVPAGMYVADPEAHLWEDGKLYIYGSRDESDDFWCSYSHHVLSTNDLVNWHIDENAFVSKGEGDQIAYHDELLFAPDCAYKDGTYYLYYCSPDKKFTEGVATSKSPHGPFVQGKHIKGAYQIDPAVFIDTDRQGYYYWGQGSAKVAKLKPNMIEIDTTKIIEPLDKLGNKNFHEGSSIRKIGNKYYLVFADESRRGRPTCLGYAISDSPMGPFIYKGVIIDNFGSDPAVWNNHGSIEEFKGQWYVFYHRSTHNSQKFRKACVEPIKINKDGTIDEVEMTSQGAGSPIKADSIVKAEWTCGITGNARIELQKNTDSPNEVLAKIENDDTAVFKYLYFKKGLKKLKVKTLNSCGGVIEFRMDNADGKKIAEIEIPMSSAKNTFDISETNISKIDGKHAVYLVFKGEEDVLFDIDWFSFY